MSSAIICQREIPLASGTLRLSVHEAELPLDELCGYASRRSRKRGFVFVSKVLGKHYPVRPRTMLDTHRRLAARLHDIARPAVVIALAETATALGQGVYEQLLRQTQRDDILFLHSTRYHLQRPLALRFEEAHSHATQHRLYEPLDPAHAQLFHRAEALVLVDDEISTGNTLLNLASAYGRAHPQLREVHYVCLTDWLGTARRHELCAALPVPTRCHSLLSGEFAFAPRDDFDPGVIPDVTGGGGLKDGYLPRNYGRLGQLGLLELAHLRGQDLPRAERTLVLGTGEFAYPPFRLALHLEELGRDVCYQSTTRSPLLSGADLRSVLEFTDNYHDGMPNYLYNATACDYAQIVIGYETQPLPAEHDLPQRLGAHTLHF